MTRAPAKPPTTRKPKAPPKPPAKASARGARDPQVASPPRPTPAPPASADHPIRRWRDELRLTRAELARMAAVSSDTIAGLEVGHSHYCGCDKARRIAAAFGIETDTLIDALIAYWGDTSLPEGDCRWPATRSTATATGPTWWSSCVSPPARWSRFSVRS